MYECRLIAIGKDEKPLHKMLSYRQCYMTNSQGRRRSRLSVHQRNEQTKYRTLLYGL